MQSNWDTLLVNAPRDQLSCSLSTAPMWITHGVPGTLAAYKSNAPIHYLKHLKPATHTLSVQAVVKHMTEATVAKEEEDLWAGTCMFVESKQNSGATLFVTWFRSRALLVGKLRQFELEVKHIHSTRDKRVFNVAFDSHACARKAFTMQRTIGVRMVPPKKSHFKWLRHPSPKFIVKYETKRLLIIRKGKAETHGIVGELLPTKNKEQRCFVWADQLKGHRIHIIGCEGILYQDGVVVKMTAIPRKFEGVVKKGDRVPSLGWISYKSKFTKEKFVERRSGNLLSDYIYRG